MTRRRLSSAAARRGDLVCDWVETFCTHVKGDLAGRSLVLDEWQRQWVREVFGPQTRDGRRKTRTALLGVPRKAGKSTLSAALALYGLFADGEQGAEVYAVAGDRDQARNVFDAARAMVQANPTMSQHAKVCRNWIEVPSTNSLFRVLSADGRRQHGLNPHMVVFDELHVQPTPELWEAMTSGMGARSQPLTIAITTAGFDRQSICYELYDYGRRIESGQVDDPAWHFRWFGADEGDDWTDRAVWAKAHPGLGASVRHEFLESEFRQAEAQPSRQNTFRRLYLNQWTSADVRWIDLGLWDRNAGLTVDEGQLAGRECFGGLDLASTSDFAALVWLFPDGDQDETSFRVVCRFWLPRAAVERRSRMRATLEAWERDGWLQVTDGDVIDYDTVYDTICRDAARFNVIEMAHDPWNAHQLVQNVHGSGIKIWPLQQSIGQLSPPSKTLEILLGEERLRHGGHPILRWMADNVVVRSDASENIRPDKDKSTEKIDGIVALVIAIAAATREEQHMSIAANVW